MYRDTPIYVYRDALIYGGTPIYKGTHIYRETSGLAIGSDRNSGGGVVLLSAFSLSSQCTRSLARNRNKRFGVAFSTVCLHGATTGDRPCNLSCTYGRCSASSSGLRCTTMRRAAQTFRLRMRQAVTDGLGMCLLMCFMFNQINN